MTVLLPTLSMVVVSVVVGTSHSCGGRGEMTRGDTTPTTPSPPSYGDSATPTTVHRRGGGGGGGATSALYRGSGRASRSTK